MDIDSQTAEGLRPKITSRSKKSYAPPKRGKGSRGNMIKKWKFEPLLCLS